MTTTLSEPCEPSTISASRTTRSQPSLPPQRHPIGLFIVCAVELCERFSGTLLASLLVLYLNERLGMTQGAATRLSGVFSGMAYVSSLAGGVLAERVLGTRRAILLGLVLLTLGYAALSVDRAISLYPALVLLIAGQALFKPNLTASVSKLYSPDDKRREDAYGLFYTAINISAAFAPLAGGALRSAYGWRIAFAVAGVAMLMSIGVFVIGYRRISATATGTACSRGEPPGSRAVVVTLARALPSVAGLLGAVLLFTAAFEQSGQSLVFWARDCTRRVVLGYTVPPSYFLAAPGALVLLLQPALGALMRSLRMRGREPSAHGKLAAGLVFSALAYVLMTWASVVQSGAGQVSAFWLIGCFCSLTIAELLIYPIGMALVTRLVPASAAAGAMSLWLVAIALGQWLAGELGALWEIWPHVWFFVLAAGCSIGALGMLALSWRRIA